MRKKRTPTKRIPGNFVYFISGDPKMMLEVFRAFQVDVVTQESMDTYDLEGHRIVQPLLHECTRKIVADQIYQRYHNRDSPVRVWRRKNIDSKIHEVDMGTKTPEPELKETIDPRKIPGVVFGSSIKQPEETKPF